MPVIRALLLLLLLCLVTLPPQAVLAQLTGFPPSTSLAVVPPSPEAEEDAPLHATEEAKQLNSLLSWAIGARVSETCEHRVAASLPEPRLWLLLAAEHADPAELQRMAAAATAGQLPEGAHSAGDGSAGARKSYSLDELRAKQAKVREAMEYMQSLPTEAEVVQLAVAGLTRNDTGTDDAGKEHSLEVLLEYASLIDVANDFDALGAIQPVVAMLSHPAAHIRALAAHVIAAAAANNPDFGAHATGHGAVGALLGRLHADETEPRVKALFALAQLIRPGGVAREAFLALSGLDTLRALVAAPAEVLKLRLRALMLLADVGLTAAVLPTGVDQLAGFAGGAVQLLAVAADGEHDALEKVLRACSQLMRSPGGAHLVQALRVQGAPAALKAARTQLLSAGSDQPDSYLSEVEALRQEVQGQLEEDIMPQQQRDGEL